MAEEQISAKSAGPPGAESGAGRAGTVSLWRKVLPYLGTVLIFAFIFWRIPLGAVGHALGEAPVWYFLALFLPFSAWYWLVDSFCLTWVVRRFNAQMRFREIAPIRASMYILALLNTNLGQGGVAYYLHRKGRIPFLEALSSILFIALMEVYQLLFFSTLGVVFYSPTTLAQIKVVRLMRTAYVIGWALLFGLMAAFAAARRSAGVKEWIAKSRFGALAGTFAEARPIDYATVLALKVPGFLASILTHYVALRLYGIAIPLAKLVLFLPLVFLAAALPIAVAHLGTSQAAWLVFFSSDAPAASILAYSLVAHFAFMLANGLIGVFFLPRASRELGTVENAA